MTDTTAPRSLAKPFVPADVRHGQATVTFAAWNVCESGNIPLRLGAPETPQDALNAALACNCLHHKDTLLIRHQDAGKGKAWLRAYAIKRRSQPRWVRGPDMTSHPVHELYAAELFTCPVDAFEPTRAFDAFRDNAAGRDLTLVDGDARKLREQG